MVSWVRKKHVARVLLALYVLAALSFGFAHRRPSFEALADPIDAAAYALPDGSLPVLCLTDTAASGRRAPQYGHASCDACGLTSAPGLPVDLLVTAMTPAASGGALMRIPPDADDAIGRPDNVRSRAPPMQRFSMT